MPKVDFSAKMSTETRQKQTSVVGSKAANGGRVKTGQRMYPGTWFFYPIISCSCEADLYSLNLIY